MGGPAAKVKRLFSPRKESTSRTLLIWREAVVTPTSTTIATNPAREKPSEPFDEQFKEIKNLKDRNFKERKNEERNFETQLKQIDTSKREMKQELRSAG